MPGTIRIVPFFLDKKIPTTKLPSFATSQHPDKDPTYKLFQLSNFWHTFPTSWLNFSLKTKHKSFINYDLKKAQATPEATKNNRKPKKIFILFDSLNQCSTSLYRGKTFISKTFKNRIFLSFVSFFYHVPQFSDGKKNTFNQKKTLVSKPGYPSWFSEV